MNVVLRITRHALDEERMTFLRDVFGNDLLVVTEDIRYGDNPVANVSALIERTEQEGDDRKVIALEAQAPFPVLVKLVDAKLALGVDLIRAQFARDEGGRAIVRGQDAGGRDILAFSHYEKLERIEFLTRPLTRSGS